MVTLRGPSPLLWALPTGLRSLLRTSIVPSRCYALGQFAFSFLLAFFIFALVTIENCLMSVFI
jgi:hypothetical protein